MEENEKKEVVNENYETVVDNKTEEVINDSKNTKGSYITGTVGAVLGGLVASIPWILTYSFANMIVAVLATLIAGGAFGGYKIFKGKIGKALPVIITIVSLLVVTVVTTVICPTIFMAQAGFPITIDNLKGLYSDARSDVRSAIIQDLIVSLIFTVLGIAAVVNSIRIQIKNGASNGNLQFSTQAMQEEMRKQLQEQVDVVKKACKTLNCLEKENAVEKQEILNELEMTYNIEHKKVKQYFAACSSYKLLKKYKGKYYYDEANEQIKLQNTVQTSPKATIIIIVVALVIGVIIGILTTLVNTNSEYTIPNTDIKLEISNSQLLYASEEEITQVFGEEAATYYDFIVIDGEKDKYEIYGQRIEKTEYEGYDFATIMEADRDYYAQYMGEEIISEVSDKKFGDKNLKAYNYTYEGNDGNQYRAIIYLYNEETNYLWINVYTDMDVELTRVDTIVDNLLK